MIYVVKVNKGIDNNCRIFDTGYGSYIKIFVAHMECKLNYADFSLSK